MILADGGCNFSGSFQCISFSFSCHAIENNSTWGDDDDDDDDVDIIWTTFGQQRVPKIIELHGDMSPPFSAGFPNIDDETNNNNNNNNNNNVDENVLGLSKFGIGQNFSICVGPSNDYSTDYKVVDFESVSHLQKHNDR